MQIIWHFISVTTRRSGVYEKPSRMAEPSGELASPTLASAIGALPNGKSTIKTTIPIFAAHETDTGPD
jgi:hypothetical protein